jgi:hypothetical protein
MKKEKKKMMIVKQKDPVVDIVEEGEERLGVSRRLLPNQEVLRSLSGADSETGVVLKFELMFRDERWWQFGWKSMWWTVLGQFGYLGQREWRRGKSIEVHDF